MVCLILSIGLAVDYSSHIGYKFMVYKGTKSERAKASLINMGPAVFNGGFSTFLPIIMLAGSNIYVTLTFFKVCFFFFWNDDFLRHYNFVITTKSHLRSYLQKRKKKLIIKLKNSNKSFTTEKKT